MLAISGNVKIIKKHEKAIAWKFTGISKNVILKCNYVLYLDPPFFSLLKPKSSMIKKFFNEPVDALDSRLANAEENLSCLPIDPFNDIKQVKVETF